MSVYFCRVQRNKRKMDNNKTTETFTSVGIEDLVEAEKRWELRNTFLTIHNTSDVQIWTKIYESAPDISFGDVISTAKHIRNIRYFCLQGLDVYSFIFVCWVVRLQKKTDELQIPSTNMKAFHSFWHFWLFSCKKFRIWLTWHFDKKIIFELQFHWRIQLYCQLQ